jgi:hypothetical protein
MTIIPFSFFFIFYFPYISFFSSHFSFSFYLFFSIPSYPSTSLIHPPDPDLLPSSARLHAASPPTTSALRRLHRTAPADDILCPDPAACAPPRRLPPHSTSHLPRLWDPRAAVVRPPGAPQRRISLAKSLLEPWPCSLAPDLQSPAGLLRPVRAPSASSASNRPSPGACRPPPRRSHLHAPWAPPPPAPSSSTVGLSCSPAGRLWAPPTWGRLAKGRRSG